MFKRVLFVIPPFSSEWAGHPHTGVGYLSVFLERNEEDVKTDVLDLGLEYNKEDLHRRINAFKPDLVAFTMMSYRYNAVYRLIEQIKGPNYKIVVGGPHVSDLRSNVLEHCSADFAVKNEGEFTLLELCKGEDLADIGGLIFRNGEDIVENKDRPLIKDLDEIPFPTYDHFELERYSSKEILLVSSRGCPYGCIYCSVRNIMGRKFRSRSAENVVEEIRYWRKRGYRRFSFIDDNFTFDKERVYEICDLMDKHDLKDLMLTCENGVRADRVDRDLLKRMKEVGFKLLAFGVEGGNNRVLRRIRKAERIETIEQAIKDACELEFDVHLFFMIGHPEETPADVEDSINLALKYPIADAVFYNIIPLPNTELYEWIKQNDYFLIEPEKYLSDVSTLDTIPVFETPEFPLEKRVEALVKTQAVRKKIKIRHMERKLKRFGIVGKIGARITYVDAINRLINKSGPHRKILVSLVEKLTGQFIGGGT